MNAISLAKLGIGFGPRHMAAIGLAAGLPKPTEQWKASIPQFGISGRAIFVPYPDRPRIAPPAIIEKNDGIEFDEFEQVLMLFAVASLDS